ncbi:MAG: pyridoxamine 5'-phosphate oxidase family protein [Clostridiales bacterium]|nr:pyridoxamine 5'-phosphate oxidase family protein [Clostridiales bacterium]
MRRKDREITDPEEIKAIIRKASVCRVAFYDDIYPYIVPLNFGYEEGAGKVTLYFHCANEGKKLDLLRRNPHVAFEMDCPDKFYDGDKACYSTMDFESVCGNGTLEIVGDDEKIPALMLIMQQYSNKRDFDFDALEVKAVTVLKLSVNEMTGKRLKQA